MIKQLFSIPVIAVGLVFASPAAAQVTIYNSAGNVQPEENVLLPQGQVGQTITGVTNQTDTSVTFVSTADEELTTPANGQARIETTEDPSSLSGLLFYLTNGESFTEFEFDLHQSLTANQTVTLYYEGPESGSMTYNLGNGANWLAGEADQGYYFTKIEFGTSGQGVTDIRQIRLGGIGAITAPVPEPSTWLMMFIGFAALGLFMRSATAGGASLRVVRRVQFA